MILKTIPGFRPVFLRRDLVSDVSAELSLYAVNHQGIHFPTDLVGRPRLAQRYQSQKPAVVDPSPSPYRDGKGKFVAAFLAFFFGMLGVHRFYLGQKLKGILYMLAFVFSLIISFEGDAPIVFFSFIIPWMDAILFLVMPRGDFDKKYNEGRSSATFIKLKKKLFFRRSKNPTFSLLKKGLRKFKSGQYQHANNIF